jgi:hypothetical protein
MIAPKPYRLAAIAGVHRSVLWTRPKLYQQK